MTSPRLTKLLIEAMAKHLPPSASALRLVDVGGASQSILTTQRADLEVIPVAPDSAWTLESDSVDAVVAFDHALEPTLLTSALASLRVGGRLIVVTPTGEPDETRVKTLEEAGYTRILVESAVECPLPTGVLMRGEKPHVTADTLQRIQAVADQETNRLTLTEFKGRFVQVLVIQTPNKPVWKMAEGEQYRWQAVTANGALVAFGSLPKAVAFMQPAVLEGLIVGVNKVAKFSVATAQAWQQPVLINPDLDQIRGQTIAYYDLNPTTAEASDE